MLDTNVLLALLDEHHGSLSDGIMDALRAQESSAMVSAASLWEIAIKHRLGKLPLVAAPQEIPDRIAHFPGMTLLDVSATHVLREVSPWPDTNDPFDRLLLAVADVERARLLTTDRKLINHPLAWRPA